jgi:aryl-alcohol dehydrogenase-like predicted oxidoreductase
MRRVTLGGTGITASCLGFGCAALGSRVGAAAGRRALEEAFDAGVTWFDLAPVYGGGLAEEIAAPFLAAHRDEVQVCTKAGLELAGGAGAMRRRLAPLARRALSASGRLGGALGAGMRRVAPRANAKQTLTPALLTASLEASLRRLDTDHVTLFALHGATAEELALPEIRRALEDVVASGRARAVGVAGDARASARALEIGAPYDVVQLPLSEPGSGPGSGPDAGPDAGPDLFRRVREAGRGLVTHSVFGGRGAAPGGDGEARLQLRRAFALNPDGIVLVSMFDPAHRRMNLETAAEPDRA